MNVVISQVQPKSVLVRMAHNFGIEPEKMLGTLKATAFKGDVSNEQMMALLVVAEQYNLNPWTKEIYAFPDRNHGIVPVVGVDGWSRIINSHPQFDGMDFEDGPLNDRKLPEWIECVMHRKDRSHPVKVKEYFAEVARDVGPWKSHPRRMLRHKAMIQCARLAFGFVGIYDEDEGERIRETIDVTPNKVDPRGDFTGVNYELRDRHVNAIIDLMNQDKNEAEISADLNAYVDEHLNRFQELYITVLDKLAADKIVSKANWKKYLALASNPREQH
jgi:phage recombination protein Bet